MTEPQTIDNTLANLDEYVAEITRDRASDQSETVDYYMKKSVEFAAQEAKVQAEYDVLRRAIDMALDSRLAEIRNWRAGLEYQFGPEVQAAVHRQIGKQRHIKTAWGKIGFRKTPEKKTVVIDNKDDAAEWAFENCPGAVKVDYHVNKTPLKKAMEDGAEVPGAHLETTEASERFYVDTPKIRALTAQEQKQLEGDDHGATESEPSLME